MDWSALLGYLKLPARIAAAVACAALALLLLPESWLSAIRLGNVRQEHGTVIGFALIGAAALLVADLSARIVKAVLRRRRQSESNRRWQERARYRAELREQEAARERETAKAREEAEQARQTAEAAAADEQRMRYLHSLTAREREQCRKFIEHGARTHWLNAEDGVVTELTRRGVIYQSNAHMHVDLNFQAWGAYFTMHDWAWDYLQGHPELIADPDRDDRRR